MGLLCLESAVGEKDLVKYLDIKVDETIRKAIGEDENRAKGSRCGLLPFANGGRAETYSLLMRA